MSKALATKYVAAALLAVALVLGFSLAFAQPAKADQLSNLQAQVNSLLAQISALQGPSSTSMSGSGCHTFTMNAKVGSSGGEVMWIQQFLNGHGAVVAASGAGSPGNETSHFGPATKAAVMKFQNANAASILTPLGLSKGTGTWGAATRAQANALCASPAPTTTTTTTATGPGPVGTTTVPSGPGISISSGAVPAASLAPQGAVRIPFTMFTLTNNNSAEVTITSITVQRVGLAQDAAFSGVVLLDSNGLQVGIAHSFNSNHQTNIGDTFTLQPGQSMTYTVAGNMASSLTSYSGQVAAIDVVGVNTSVPVSGTLPIHGASQTVNSTLSIGSVSTSTSSFDPGAAQTKNLGDTAVRVSGVRFTANSSEDVKLYSIRWRQTGTASGADVSNVMTIVNGTSYPATVDSSGKYYTTTFPGGILVTKGNSFDVHIQADVTGSNSAARTLEMDIDKVTDVYFVGQTYGYGVSVSGGAGSPWFKGFVTTINAGSATAIQNATSVAAANVPVNINNTVLGGFQTNFQGEQVTVTGMTFSVATSSGASTGDLTSVSVVDENGAVVSGPVDQAATATNGSASLVFTDSVTFKTGLHSYTIKGKVPSGWTNGSTFTLSTTPSSQWTSPTGQTSGNTITLPGLVTMNQMTVRAAQVTITASPNPTARNIIPANAIELGDVVIDAGQSGEDLRFNSLPLNYSFSAAGAATDVNTCQLYNGATPLNNGTNVVKPTATGGQTFTFDNSLTVAKGTQLTLLVKCNLKSGVTGAYQWGVMSTSTFSITGVQSGNSVSGASLNVTTGYSGLQTAVSGGTLTFSVDPSSPSYALAAGGTAGQLIGVYKLRAVNGPVTVTDLGLTVINSSTSSKATADGNASAAATDIGALRLCTDAACAAQIGSATFINSQTGNITATSTLSSGGLVVNPGTDTLVYAKVDLANVGAGMVGGIGDVLKVEPLNAKGTSGGSAVNIAGTGTVAGVQLYRAYPTLAAGPAAPVNPNGTNAVIKKFSITASNNGNGVAIYQIPFSISTSSATVNTFKLFAYTGSDYATGPASGIGASGQFGVTSGTTAASLCASPCNTVSSPTLNFYAASSSPLYISAGATRYFVLTATVNPNSGVTNWNVNATLVGTSTASSAASGLLGTGYQAGTSTAGVWTTSEFIWSDMASTSAVAADPDWTNGFSVPGLSASGL